MRSWHLRLVALLAAAAVAGCGSSSSSSSSSGPTTGTGSAQQLLLTGVVAGDAYTDWLYSGAAQTLTEQKAVAARFRDAVYNQNIALRKLRIPAAARAPLSHFLAASSALSAGLDALRAVQSASAMKATLTGKLSSSITAYENAERPLRVALGIPPFRWLHTQPLGPRVYSDTLAAPHAPIKWLLGKNVSYTDGGLQLTTPKENGLTGPTTPYNFDSRHVSVQVDVRALRGDPYTGILCPGVLGQSGTYLSAQIGPGAKYSFGLFRANGASALLRGPLPSKQVRAGAVNHIRVDCDEYSSQFTTLRLYIAGKLADFVSAPVGLTPNQEAGLVVVRSGPAPAAVLFKNWSVWKLSGTR